MRKILIFLFLGILQILNATIDDQNATNFKSAFRIDGKTQTSMQITFRLPDYQLSSETLGTQSYNRIAIPGSQSFADTGMPELPFFSTSLAIPATGKVSVEILSASEQVLSDFRAYPVQTDFGTELPKGVSVNDSYYQSGGDYPDATLRYGDPVILRDLRIVTIQVNPFVYNALSHKLTIRDEICLKVNFEPGKGENELDREPLQLSPSFAAVYESLILNYDDYRGALMANVPPRILIIYGNSTDTTYLDAINNFALWKRQKGADVLMASTATSQAGNTTTSIKNYIQSKYDNIGTRPDFVILIGDVSGSFPIPAFTVSSGGGDYPYTHLAGGDALGDCFIGRISVENTTQLATMLAKTYLYERDINTSNVDWLNRMLLVGDWDPSGISCMYINKYIKEISSAVNFHYSYTELYSANPAPASMNTALNAGVGIFNYRGYIGMSSWSPSETSLYNGYMLPHAVIITCATGNYASGTGTTETFTRLGTSAVPKGAVTAIGMSTSSTHTTFNNVLTGGIFDGIFIQGMRTMGEAMLHGKLYMNQMFGISSPTNATNFAHWCNLMGDPSMEVFIGIPSTYLIQVPANIPIGSALLDVIVSNASGDAVKSQCVTLSYGSIILASAYTDETGLASLVLPTGLVAGTAVITVSGHNFKPLQQNISIVAGGVVPGSVIVDDNNSGASQGNSDALANAGEILELSFPLQNTSSSNIRNLRGNISCSSSYVSIQSTDISFGDLAAGATSSNTAPIVVTVSAACPNGNNLRFALQLSSGSGTSYNVSLHLVVYNGKLELVSQQVIEPDDSALDPDETAGIRIGIRNIGAMTLQNLNAQLSSSSSFVSINTPQASYGNLAPQGQALPASDFNVYISSLCIPGMVIPFDLRVFNASGFEQVLSLTFTVGNISVTDPLGPDSYGYVIYDTGDLNYDDCPTYSWIGIAPAEGGSGTSLAITDAYYSGDEGDQVSADALEVVVLPFRYKFYGISYDRITVCSNGFLALGETGNAEFRNFRLPGAMGPSPMIAPFWDDLATTANSGIYKYYNSTQHYYVIEWYNLVNGKDGSSLETFQVILYDQAYHASSTGDGPILIQYKNFNNVDSQSGERHGNFCTIGIEDHTGTRGLEYTFNNAYPTAAAPLSNFKALYITTLPQVTPGPSLRLSEVIHYDTNENGFLEPGETDYATLVLKNVGDAIATNVNAILSTDDPYVNIINSAVSYGNIPVMETANGSAAFIFSISATCPQDHLISFSLNISSSEGTWQRNMSLSVHKPVLQYQNWVFDDFALNLNGLPDPGETGTMVFNLYNETGLEATNSQVSISESSPYISFTPTIISCGNISGSVVFQAATQLAISSSAAVGTIIPVTLNITSDNGEPQTVQFNLNLGQQTCSWDFENNNGDFTVVNSVTPGWEWGTSSYAGASSGTKVWGTVLNGYHASNAVYQLISPPINLGSNTQLTFKHRYHAERTNNSTYWDGGQVQISVNNGATWNMITPVGGYPVSAVAALNYQPGYSGEVITWQTATFSLSAYSGQSAKIRWYYASDTSVNFEGWFVDDVSFENAAGNDVEVGKVSGNLDEITIDRDLSGALVSIGDYALLPSVTGSFSALVPAGNYSAQAVKEGYRSIPVPITISAGTQISDLILDLEFLPYPENISWLIDGAVLSLRWSPVSDARIAEYRIYAKGDIGAWQLLGSTNTCSFSCPLSSSGTQFIKVTAYYNDGWESLQPDCISFVYPFGGIDVQPAAISSINLLQSPEGRIVSWSPVQTDTQGNPITVWGYRIYAGSTPYFECSAANLIGTSWQNSFTDTGNSNRRFYRVKAVLGYLSGR